MEKKPIITYPIDGTEAKPVINIAGRDYAIIPYEIVEPIPTHLIEFSKRHPEHNGINFQFNQSVSLLLADILNYLKAAMAITAVEEESENEDYKLYRLMLPVLMPLDTTQQRQKQESEHNILDEQQPLFKLAENS